MDEFDIDFDNPFEAGGAVVIILFAVLVWYPALLNNAGDPSAASGILKEGITLLLYSVVPTTEMAVYVDIMVAVSMGYLAIDKLGARERGIIFAAGVGWMLANMIMTVLNPPV